MKDLPSMYAAVCAKRPELAVPHLSYRTWEGDPSDGLWLALDAWECESEIPPTHAAALILARWVESLPCGYKLSKQDDHECEDTLDGEMWWVEDYFHEKHEGFARTPLEALAAFYLGDTQ